MAGNQGFDGPIEAHVLLKDFHRHPFDRYVTLHEEQVSWPILQKPVYKTTLATTGHDKAYDKDYVSTMQQSRKMKQPLYHIQDMEPIMMTAGSPAGFGKLYDEPLVSAFTDKQLHMDVDWLGYT